MVTSIICGFDAEKNSGLATVKLSFRDFIKYVLMDRKRGAQEKKSPPKSMSVNLLLK